MFRVVWLFCLADGLSLSPCAHARPTRNPLHAVAGCARFLLERSSPGDAVYEDVTTILSGASQMSRLITDIMDWSKVSAGKVDLVLEAAYVPSLLKDVVRAMPRLCTAVFD
jgi:signal transduction histidine kinase